MDAEMNAYRNAPRALNDISRFQELQTQYEMIMREVFMPKYSTMMTWYRDLVSKDRVYWLKGIVKDDAEIITASLKRGLAIYKQYYHKP